MVRAEHLNKTHYCVLARASDSKNWNQLHCSTNFQKVYKDYVRISEKLSPHGWQVEIGVVEVRIIEKDTKDDS